MTTKTKIADMTDATAAAVKSNVDQSVSAMKEGVATATAEFHKGQAKYKSNMEKAVKTAEEFVAFGQGNMEAVVKSSQIFAAGMQDIGKRFAAHAQASFEESMATAKAVAGSKSVKEALEVQTAYARAAVEKAIAESSKLTEVSLKLVEQASAPLTARMTLAVEKFSKAA